MSLLNLVIVIVIVGVLLWVINKYVPMATTVKNILNITVVILLVIWILKAVGFIDYVAKIHL